MAGHVHAGCIVVRETGILIRGAAGAGKSSLAREAVDGAGAAGWFAAHVADDRVRLSVRHGRLVARPVPAIAGRLEVRGVGIVAVRSLPAAVLGLVVDLLPDEPPRLPGPDAGRTEIEGVVLPRLATTRREAISLLLWRLRGMDDTSMTDV